MNFSLIPTETNAIANVMDGALVSFGKPNKDGVRKAGSFARAIAFATREERQQAGQAMYAKWLATGNYRPLVNDMLSVKLVSKDAADYIERTTLRAFAGHQIPKAKLVEISSYIVDTVRNRVTAGKPEPKGEKAFVFEVCKRIAEDPEFKAGDVIEA